MTKYRVTIHDHVIYDYVVDASDKNTAINIAEESIVNEEKHLWTVDEMAGWTDIGSIYNDVGEEL
jgi:hypothetical protein